MVKEEQQKQKEIDLLLEEIKNASSVEFATEVANRLDHKKHTYGTDGEVNQLRKIVRLLDAGACPQEALEIVDNCIDVDGYIKEVYGRDKDV